MSPDSIHFPLSQPCILVKLPTGSEDRVQKRIALHTDLKNYIMPTGIETVL